MIDELVEWLRGVLDEDERLVLMLPRAEWTWERNRAATVRIGETDVDVSDVRWGAHMERHDPASVFADVAAKRAIIEETIRPHLGMDTTTARVAWQALRLLASAYADRPGYRPEWTPR